MMNRIASILEAARRMATVAPDPRVAMTVDDLAFAMHAVENNGRTGRFGAAYCRHQEKAQSIVAYLQERTG